MTHLTFTPTSAWFAELDTYATLAPIKCIVGNKTDRENSRIVKAEEGRRLAQEKDCSFFELSAKQGVLVEEMFDAMVDKVRFRGRVISFFSANILFTIKIIASPTLLQPATPKPSQTFPGSLPSTITLGNEENSSWTGCSC